MSQRAIALPVVIRRIDDNALHRYRCVVCVPAGAIAVIALWDDDASAVRIEQDLVAIEPVSVLGVVRTVGAVGVDLSGLDAGHEDVPVVVRPVGVRIEADRARRVPRFPGE